MARSGHSSEGGSRVRPVSGEPRGQDPVPCRFVRAVHSALESSHLEGQFHKRGPPRLDKPGRLPSAGSPDCSLPLTTHDLNKMFALRSARQAPRLFVRHLSTPVATYKSIILSNPLPSVTLITLNRPKALNGTSPSPLSSPNLLPSQAVELTPAAHSSQLGPLPRAQRRARRSCHGRRDRSCRDYWVGQGVRGRGGYQGDEGQGVRRGLQGGLLGTLDQDDRV